MLSRPDLLIGKPESSEAFLVVEIKGDVSAASPEGLKKYMIRSSCPAGMLVTPESVLFFRNNYTDYLPASVEEIGRCSTSDLLGRRLDNRRTESDLADLIEQWLSGLSSTTRQSWPSGAREAIETVVFPAVVEGILRTAGPRLQRAS